LSGDRELLLQIAEKDPKIKVLLGSEIVIADLVKKSKLTINYTNLTRAKELTKLLNTLMESGCFPHHHGGIPCGTMSCTQVAPPQRVDFSKELG